MQEYFKSDITPPSNIQEKYKENPALALIDMKEFVIGYMRDFESKIIKDYQKTNENFQIRFEDLGKKHEYHDVKIESILDETQAFKNKTEKINDLIAVSKKNSDQIMTIEIKMNSLQKEFSNACYKYDKIYLDNLVIPGTIGDYCRYKNLKEYLEVIFFSHKIFSYLFFETFSLIIFFFL